MKSAPFLDDSADSETGQSVIKNSIVAFRSSWTPPISPLDQLVEELGFPGEWLFQELEEVFARRPLIVVSELDRPGGANMEPEEVVVDEPFLAEEEEIEPFGWEDYLCESWLEEQMQKERRKPAEAGV